MTQPDFSDYFLGGIALFIFLCLLAAFIKDLMKWIFGKKKIKVKKEYEVKVFITNGSNTEIVFYHRGAVANVSWFGRKYIRVKLHNGDSIEYEGFNFIVNTYKINI